MWRTLCTQDVKQAWVLASFKAKYLCISFGNSLTEPSMILFSVDISSSRIVRPPGEKNPFIYLLIKKNWIKNFFDRKKGALIALKLLEQRENEHSNNVSKYKLYSPNIFQLSDWLKSPYISIYSRSFFAYAASLRQMMQNSFTRCFEHESLSKPFKTGKLAIILKCLIQIQPGRNHLGYGPVAINLSQALHPATRRLNCACGWCQQIYVFILSSTGRCLHAN